MDLIDTLNRLASRVRDQRDALGTEEATKNALVMPLINALGYNVFDPLEVVPEFTADVGTKKGEKVDYAINIGGKPMILIECKTAGTTLKQVHTSQLYRYFSVTEARFAVLTNGVEFMFYTDIESPNRMDAKPFFEFSMLDVSERSVEELKKFTKANFDLDNILSNASELKYVKQIQKCLREEYDYPTEDFVRLFASRVYSGKMTSSVRDQFQVLVKKAFRDFLRDEVNSRLKSALEGTSGAVEIKAQQQSDEDDNGIVTTEEEVEAYHIVRAIVSREVDPARVVIRDTKSYCGILLDDNNRKPICRLRFNASQNYIGLFDDAKKEERSSLDNLKGIYDHQEALLSTVKRYDTASE